MKKFLLSLLLTVVFIAPVFAAVPVDPAYNGVSITNANTTNSKCRAVWIGTTQDLEFYMNGAWVVFKGASAGSIIPVQATGARIDSGDAAPSAGDVVFLY